MRGGDADEREESARRLRSEVRRNGFGERRLLLSAPSRLVRGDEEALVTPLKSKASFVIQGLGRPGPSHLDQTAASGESAHHITSTTRKSALHTPCVRPLLRTRASPAGLLAS